MYYPSSAYLKNKLVSNTVKGCQFKYKTSPICEFFRAKRRWDTEMSVIWHNKRLGLGLNSDLSLKTAAFGSTVRSELLVSRFDAISGVCPESCVCKLKSCFVKLRERKRERERIFQIRDFKYNTSPICDFLRAKRRWDTEMIVIWNER